MREMIIVATIVIVNCTSPEIKATVAQTYKDESLTPLMEAAGKGDSRTVQQLIAEGVDINLGNKRGETAIYIACEASHTEVVKLLIQAKADVNIATTYGNETPLIAAANKGNDEILTMLINAKARINPKPTQSRYQTDETALMAAAGNGHASSVKLLIKAKARLNDQDGKGRTALFRASEAGHTEVVKILIKAGTNLNLQGPAEHTALSFARNDEIRRLLKAAGAK